jgi:hypothetical protein
VYCWHVTSAAAFFGRIYFADVAKVPHQQKPIQVTRDFSISGATVGADTIRVSCSIE